MQCDLIDDHIIYVRGKQAQIVHVDFPLVYYTYDEHNSVKHRDFQKSKRGTFKVLLGGIDSQLPSADPCSIAVEELAKQPVSIRTQSEDENHNKQQEDSVMDKLASSCMPTKDVTAAGGGDLHRIVVCGRGIVILE
jgi:hypothetical protein